MRILFVEDNKSFADVVSAALVRACTKAEIKLASSLEAADDLIRAEFFDLVVLDLSIPSTDGGLDKDVSHGQSFFYLVQEIAPGTPVYILTGSEPDSFAIGLSRHGEQLDLWGAGTPVPTVLYFPKDQAQRLIDELCSVAAHVDGLDEITINTRGVGIKFAPEQSRALKIFTKGSGGASCTFSPLGGLSGSLVGRVSVNDFRGNVITVCIAKLGDKKKIQREIESYERHVKLMKMHVFAPLLSFIEKGLKQTGAIFYALADGYDQSFFDVLQTDSKAVEKIIEQLRSGIERWTAAKELKRVSIGDIRKTVLRDESLAEIREKFDLPFIDHIEAVNVQAFSSCIHGDLHGGNVLVNEGRVPILIDFGDVGTGFSCIDPITLEMSLLFHPDAIRFGFSEELSRLADKWPDVNGYVANSALKSTINSCRNWAYDVAGDDGAVLAAGYCFAVRQLKYNDVSSEVTLSLLRSIADRLLQR